MLQVMVMRCDNVDYMFFGPPLECDDDGPNVECLAFSGLVPVSYVMELLQKALRTKDQGQDTSFQ